MSDDNVAALVYTVESSYNDVGLCDTSSTASAILWLQLLLSVLKITLYSRLRNTLFYNDTNMQSL